MRHHIMQLASHDAAPLLSAEFNPCQAGPLLHPWLPAAAEIPHVLQYMLTVEVSALVLHFLDGRHIERVECHTAQDNFEHLYQQKKYQRKHVLTSATLPAQLPSKVAYPIESRTEQRATQRVDHAVCMPGLVAGLHYMQTLRVPLPSHRTSDRCGFRTPFPYLGCVFVTLVALYQDVQGGDTVELQHTATAHESGASCQLLGYTRHSASPGMQVCPCQACHTCPWQQRPAA